MPSITAYNMHSRALMPLCGVGQWVSEGRR
jgi:hypothetical protein